MANKMIRACTVLMLSVIVTLGSPSDLKEVKEQKTNLLVIKDKEGHSLTKRQFSGYDYSQASSLAHNLNFNNVPNSAGYNYNPVAQAAEDSPQRIQFVQPPAQIIPATLVHEIHQAGAPQVIPPPAPLLSQQAQQVGFVQQPQQVGLVQQPQQVGLVQQPPLIQQIAPAQPFSAAQPNQFSAPRVLQVAVPQTAPLPLVQHVAPAGNAAHAHDPPPAVVDGLSLHKIDTPEANDARPVAGYVQLYKYAYPFVIAAQLDNFIFSCRQDNGFLVINEQLPGGAVRNQQINGEFTYHPVPGVWWFVKCVGFESGYGLDMTGVMKPGGDAGIDPNALKSLIG